MQLFFPEFCAQLKHQLSSLGDLLTLVDPALTAVATVCSVSAGLWTRNGRSAADPASRYHNHYERPAFKRQDLVLLQSAACLMEERVRAQFIWAFDICPCSITNRFRIN